LLGREARKAGELSRADESPRRRSAQAVKLKVKELLEAFGFAWKVGQVLSASAKQRHDGERLGRIEEAANDYPATV
jgi:hypothetical protein